MKLDKLHGVLGAIGIVLLLMLAHSATYDHEQTITINSFVYCDANDHNTFAIIRKDRDGNRTCEKHTILSEAQRLDEINRVWPFLTADWNTAK